VVKAALVLFRTRLPSLNALVQIHASSSQSWMVNPQHAIPFRLILYWIRLDKTQSVFSN